MANHLPISNKEARFALIGDAVLHARTLDDVLYVHVVRVTQRREEVMLNLMGQPPREVIPEPGARRPIHGRLALDRRPVVERDRRQGLSLIPTAATCDPHVRRLACSFHGRVPHDGGRLAGLIPIVAAIRHLPAVTNPLDDVIHDEHRREQLAAGHVSDDEEAESARYTVKVHRQSEHVRHRDELHDPESRHVPTAAVSHVRVDVIQTLARRDLEVLLEDLRQRHDRE